MAPSTALAQALDEVNAHDEFARLTGIRRQLVLELVLACGRELLLTGCGAADQAERLVSAVTGSPRLGGVAALAVRKWAGRAE